MPGGTDVARTHRNKGSRRSPPKTPNTQDTLAQDAGMMMMMMTFITQGGEGRGKTNRKRKATKSKGRGLEEGASRALMFFL